MNRLAKIMKKRLDEASKETNDEKKQRLILEHKKSLRHLAEVLNSTEQPPTDQIKDIKETLQKED